MRKLLLQLDSSRLPSVFDRVVAYDAGADEVMSYGAVTEPDVRDLIHGCIFTRGPKDLKNTAVFVGRADAGERARELVVKRFGGTVRAITMPDATEAMRACERAELLLNAGPAGVMLVPKRAWANRPGLKVVADVNAVPPLGVEGVDLMDDGVNKEGVTCFGALAIGNLKMKVHKACIARLFERNDLVLDAETIADVARELMAPK